MPAWTANMLAQSDGVVVLSEDLSHLGIPSVVLFPPRCTKTMLDRLATFGHRRVDCLNAGHNSITMGADRRLAEWSSMTGIEGEF
jgi:hypothetical protein